MDRCLLGAGEGHGEKEEGEPGGVIRRAAVGGALNGRPLIWAVAVPEEGEPVIDREELTALGRGKPGGICRPRAGIPVAKVVGPKGGNIELFTGVRDLGDE